MDSVQRKVEQKNTPVLREKIGMSKHHLIIEILRDFLESNDWFKFSNYVDDPIQYADEWVEQFGEKLMFDHDSKQVSKYAKLAAESLNEIIKVIKSAAEKATSLLN